VYFLTYAMLKSNARTLVQEGEFSHYFPDAKTKVVVYGTSWC
jgi:hypothetical protein